MKSSVFNTVIGITVLSLDIATRTGSVKIKIGDKTKVFDNVKFSGLLVWRFNHDMDYKIGFSYTDTIASTDRSLLPFQFIVHGHIDEPAYYMEAVEVKKSKSITVTDPFGNVMVDYVNQYHKPKYYRRYRNYLKSIDATPEG